MENLFEGDVVSKIGLGTWQLGMKGWGTGYEERELIESLKLGIRNGLNFIDTAEIYGMGKSEGLIGEALKDFDRKEYFVATKIAGFNASARRVRKSLSNSLNRLKLDHIDLYQVHWEPSIYTSIPELFKELEKVAKEGQIGHIGVSNFTPHNIEIANNSMKDMKIESNQIKFNAVERPSSEVMKFMDENKIKLIAWSPLAQGFLSGKYSKDKRPSGGIRKMNKLFSPSYFEKFDPVLGELRRISESRKVSMTSLVLAYERQLGVLPIPGFKNSNQVNEIISAISLRLTQEEMNSIESAVQGCVPIETSVGFYPRFLPNFVAKLGSLLI